MNNVKNEGRRIEFNCGQVYGYILHAVPSDDCLKLEGQSYGLPVLEKLALKCY